MPLIGLLPLIALYGLIGLSWLFVLSCLLLLFFLNFLLSSLFSGEGLAAWLKGSVERSFGVLEYGSFARTCNTSSVTSDGW